MTIEKLKALVAAGEKATQGEWKRGRLESYTGETMAPVRYVYRSEDDTPYSRIPVFGACPETEKSPVSYDCDTDALFITLSANIRPDLPAIIAKYERMEEALKSISKNIVSGYSSVTPEIREIVKQALED